MRVAVTLEQLWHDVPGGTATSVLGLVEGLARHHPEIDLVGVSARHASPPDDSFTSPIEVRQLRFGRRLLYVTWQNFGWPDVEHVTGPVEVTHATTFAIPGTVAPLVVTIHDLAFLHEPDHFTRAGLRFFDLGLRRSLRHADLVVCPSETTAADCRNVGFGDDRLRVVPWGHDRVEVTTDEIAAVRARHGLDLPYLLAVGTVEPRKNLGRLIEAAGALARNGLTLAIAGPEGWKEDLDRLVAGSPIDVRRLGFVADSDLAALYAGAEVFCAVSLREGFGMPVLEAMTQGTPVVTTRATSTAEIVGDAGVLVDAVDVDGIAEGIARALDEADSLGPAGRQRAERFSIEATSDGYAAVYEEVLGR